MVAPSVLRRWLPIGFKNGVDTSALDGAINQPNDISNVLVRYADPELAVPVGFFRAPAANADTLFGPFNAGFVDPPDERELQR